MKFNKFTCISSSLLGVLWWSDAQTYADSHGLQRADRPISQQPAHLWKRISAVILHWKPQRYPYFKMKRVYHLNTTLFMCSFSSQESTVSWLTLMLTTMLWLAPFPHLDAYRSFKDVSLNDLFEQSNGKRIVDPKIRIVLIYLPSCSSWGYRTHIELFLF